MPSLPDLVRQYRTLFLSSSPQAHSKMLQPGGNAKYYTIHSPITDGELAAHLTGTATYAVPLIGQDGFTYTVALDIDRGGAEAIRAGLHIAKDLGFVGFGIICPGSGSHDGGHIFLLLADAAAPARARALAEQLRETLCTRLNLPLSTVEPYPTGKMLRLPFGIHTHTNKRGVLHFQDGTTINLDTPDTLTTITQAMTIIAGLPKNNPDNLPVPQENPLPDTTQRAQNARGDLQPANPIQAYIQGTHLLDWLISIGARIASRTPTGYSLHCPCPFHSHNDEHPSLEVQEATNHRNGKYILLGHSPSCIFHTEHHHILNSFDAYCRWHNLTTKQALYQLYYQHRPRVPRTPKQHKQHPPTKPDEETPPAAYRSIKEQAQQRATADTQMSKGTRRVFTAVLQEVGKGLWYIRGNAHLAKAIDLSERQIQRALHWLVAQNYLTAQPRVGETTIYCVCAPENREEGRHLSPTCRLDVSVSIHQQETCEGGQDSSPSAPAPIAQHQQTATFEDSDIIRGPAGAVVYPGGAAYVPEEAQAWYEQLCTVSNPPETAPPEPMPEQPSAPLPAEPPPQPAGVRPCVPTDPVKRQIYYKLLGAAKKAKNERQARALRLRAAALLEDIPEAALPHIPAKQHQASDAFIQQSFTVQWQNGEGTSPPHTFSSYP